MAKAMTRILVAGFLACLSSVAAFSAQDATVLSGTVTTRADGMPLPGAEITLPALGLSTHSDETGRYTITIPPDVAKGATVEVRVTFEGLQPLTTRVTLSPGAVTQDFALALGYQEEITVGSRAPGVAAQQATPVAIITASEIQATGFSETSQIIQALSPSFNFPRPSITDGTDTVRPATLRGLGPDQVLVLVNGKRRHPSSLVNINNSVGRGSAGVDLNAIPPSAIERIEILRDGASAQYGSDAIAGVINIVLKATAGARLGYKGGATSKGDGELNEVSGNYGFNLHGGNVTISGEYRDRNRTNRAGNDPRPQGTDPGVPDPKQPTHRYGDGDTNDTLFFANAQVPVGAGQNRFIYGFGGVSRRLANSAGFYRLAGDARNWKQIYPQGFLPQIEPDVVDISAAGGTRGALRGWFYDASLEWGYNSLDYHVVNSLNASLGPGIPPNQTEFYAGTMVYGQFVANLDVSRPVMVGSQKVNVAFGTEWRRENYQILAGEPNSYADGHVPNQLGGIAAPGAQVFPGFRPSNEVNTSRYDVAGYVDIEGDVTDWLRLGGAGRAEWYNDFGGTAGGKVTVRIAPARQFIIRSALSNGFRAPSLQQSYFSTVSTNFLNLTGVLLPYDIGTFPVNSPVAQILGAQPLEPETSVNVSGGVVIQPVDNLQFSVDGYRIAIDSRIVLSGNLTGGSIAALLQPYGAAGARFFTNAIDTRTQGIDVEASYRWKLTARDSLRLYAGLNANDTNIVKILPTPPQLAGFENVLFDLTERNRFQCSQPRNNVILSGTWSGRPVGTLLRAQRYGEFCSLASNNPALGQTFGAKWLTDLEVNFTLQKAQLQLGVQNMFDVYPDQNIAANSNFGIQPYPSYSPSGMNGRFLYARVNYGF